MKQQQDHETLHKCVASNSDLSRSVDRLSRKLDDKEVEIGNLRAMHGSLQAENQNLKNQAAEKDRQLWKVEEENQQLRARLLALGEQV